MPKTEERLQAAERQLGIRDEQDDDVGYCMVRCCGRIRVRPINQVCPTCGVRT